jgi:hypothetical protein
VLESDFLLETMYQEHYIQSVTEPGQELFTFEFVREERTFINRTVKRIINWEGRVLEDGPFYDLETPSGYGGIYINTTDPVFIQEALSVYRRYCEEQDIIAEFIRFNPLFKNSQIIGPHLDYFSQNRLTVDIDLRKRYDEIQLGYSQTTRNYLRKPSKFRFVDSISPVAFYDLYQSTMKRNNASSNYRFSPNYFNNIFENVDCKFYGAYSHNTLVSAALVILSTKSAYYHLAGNLITTEFPNANLEMLDFICKNLKSTRQELEVLHLGGGRTDSDTDPLLGFKRKFSKSCAQYHVGGLVFNREIYDSLMKANSQESDYPKFLGYRHEAS